MAIDFNGSSQYLSASSTLLTNEPIDMVIYAYPDSVASIMVPQNIGNSGATNGYYTQTLRGDYGGDPAAASKTNDAGAGNEADSSSAMSVSTWSVMGGSWISNTSRASYLNGGSKGTNTTSVTDPTPDYISIGVLRTSALNYYWNGRLAEAYVLDANMSDAQHEARGKGYSALWDVPVKNVRSWYPLLRTTDLQNRMAGGYPDLTATGSPTDVAHPEKVIYPRLGGVMTI